MLPTGHLSNDCFTTPQFEQSTSRECRTNVRECRTNALYCSDPNSISLLQNDIFKQQNNRGNTIRKMIHFDPTESNLIQEMIGEILYEITPC